MIFQPVLTPFFPIIGMLVFQTLLVFSLTRDHVHCSRPFIIISAVLELILLSMIMASYTENQDWILVWNTIMTACRLLVAPLFLWMALELNSASPLGFSAAKFSMLVGLPLAAAVLLLATNPLHGLYLSRVWFMGNTMASERSVICWICMTYCQVIVIGGCVLFIFGIPRHFGNERIRLIFFLAAFAVIYAGDIRWRINTPVLFGINPLSGLITLGSIIEGVSVALIGFPRAGRPVDQVFQAHPEAAHTRLLLRNPGKEPDAAILTVEKILDEVAGLSAQQRRIAALVMEGRTYRVIARGLGLTERTIKYHMTQILDKCGLETREQLIAWIAARQARQTGKA